MATKIKVSQLDEPVATEAEVAIAIGSHIAAGDHTQYLSNQGDTGSGNYKFTGSVTANDKLIITGSGGAPDVIFDTSDTFGAFTIKKSNTSGFFSMMPNANVLQWIGANPTAANGANSWYLDVDNQGTMFLNILPGAGKFADVVATNNANLRPAEDNASNLGSSTYRWKDAYIRNLKVGSINQDNFSLPTVDGNDGQVMVTNGAGTVTWEDQTAVAGSQIRLYDAVVDVTGSGDYTKIADAFNAGAATVFVKKGYYVETEDIVLPGGGVLIGDGNASINFTGSYSITCDGSGGVKETTGTISINNESTTVTGVGTTFTNLSVNDYIRLRHQYFRIASITNDTSLEVNNAWQGVNISGKEYTAQSMNRGIVINNLNILNSSDDAIYLRAINGANINECRIFGCENGINVIDSYGISITQCVSANHNADGYRIDGCIETSVSDTSHGDNNNGHGIHVTGASDVITISDSSFTNNDLNGVEVNGTSEVIYINTCALEYNTGIGVNTLENTEKVQIQSCVVKDNGSYGVDFDGSENNVIGCTISDNTLAGVRTGDGGIVSNCHIEDNGDDGIEMVGDSNCVISNNHIMDNGAWGINLADGNNDNSMFTGNHIMGNTSGGVNISSGNESTKWVNNLIRNNTGTDWVDNGYHTENPQYKAFSKSDSQSSTTSTTWQQKNTLTFDTLSGQLYKVTTQASVRNSNVGGAVEVRSQLDNTTLLSQSRVYSGDSGGTNWVSDFVQYHSTDWITGDGTTMTVDIDYRVGAGGGTSYIEDARIIVERIRDN